MLSLYSHALHGVDSGLPLYILCNGDDHRHTVLLTAASDCKDKTQIRFTSTTCESKHVDSH